MDGVSYWNDSKATTFSAVLAAVRQVRENVFWIGGGKSKGGSLFDFVEKLAPGIRGAFLIGETSAELAKLLHQRGIDAKVFASLPEAVFAAAKSACSEQGNVLFSPGFASFDMFAGYAERGNCFEELVLNLQRSATFAPFKKEKILQS